MVAVLVSIERYHFIENCESHYSSDILDPENAADMAAINPLAYSSYVLALLTCGKVYNMCTARLNFQGLLSLTGWTGCTPGCMYCRDIALFIVYICSCVRTERS